MSNEQLKPCPFCGGPANIQSNMYFPEAIYAGCPMCGIYTDYVPPAEAIEAWNRRATECLQQQATAQARALEALRADSELLDWLESQVQEYLGGGPWYQAMGEAHLGRASLREALRAALRQAEEGGA